MLFKSVVFCCLHDIFSIDIICGAKLTFKNFSVKVILSLKLHCVLVTRQNLLFPIDIL